MGIRWIRGFYSNSFSVLEHDFIVSQSYQTCFGFPEFIVILL